MCEAVHSRCNTKYDCEGAKAVTIGNLYGVVSDEFAQDWLSNVVGFEDVWILCDDQAKVAVCRPPRPRNEFPVGVNTGSLVTNSQKTFEAIPHVK